MKVTIDEICMELRGECNGCKRVMLAERIEAHGIEQPSGEPVAWGDLSQIMNGFLTTDNEIADEYSRDCYQLTPLYTAPPSIDALIAEAVEAHDNKNLLIKTVNMRTQAQPYLDALIAEIDAVERKCFCDGDKLFDILDKYRGQK